jgi:hypothetical protein
MGSVNGLPTKNSSAIAPTASPHPIHHPDMLRIPRMSIASAHSGITIEIANRIRIETARSARSCGSAMPIIYPAMGAVSNYRSVVDRVLENPSARRGPIAE